MPFLTDYFDSPDIPLQIFSIASGIFAAFLASRLLRKITGRNEAWQAKSHLLFPVFAVIFVLLAKFLLKSPPIFNLALPMLLALAGTRLLSYMLRAIFSRKPWVISGEKYISGIIWLIVVLHISGELQPLVQLLDEIGFEAGKQRISILLVLQGIFIAAASLLFALWASRAIEKKIMAAPIMDMSLKVMLGKIVRSSLVVIGALAGLSAAGIDMTALSMFGGALGVGLGLGLQKIASNYVSGFIILMDRSIRIGDVVNVDNRNGVVHRLTNRYVVLKSSDGTEALIPNDTLITSTVINHSYTDRQIKILVPVAVSYKSDLDEAMQIMLTAAKKQVRVLETPEPKVFLKNFGDSGIDLCMEIWIADPENSQLSLVSAINLDIWREFSAKGIDIPYPQREIRVIS